MVKCCMNRGHSCYYTPIFFENNVLVCFSLDLLEQEFDEGQKFRWSFNIDKGNIFNT